MRCVEIDVTGVVIDVVPQPATLDLCTLLLVSPGEITPNPFALDLDAALAISGAIIGLWGLAAGIRYVIGFLRSS
jgi:hypothetical protein